MKHLLTGLGIGLAFLLAWFFLVATDYRPGAGGAGPREPGRESAPRGTDSAGGLPQRIHPVSLGGPFTFAGENIPTDSFDVAERLDEQLLRNAYFHRSTLLLLKRAPRYFPTIERILAEEGVPDDFKYLACAESTLSEAVSPAGARGVWQFMAPTARAYGLEVTSEVDERYHLERATRAAAAYLRDYYGQFGDWRLVAAAYNMGGPNLRKWMDRQRAASLFELDINKETMAYLFRIVALKSILEDPAAFGYRVDPAQTYPPLDDYRTLTVTESIPNLGDFARARGTTYRLLKVYNPWLVAGALGVRAGQSYDLRIPR